MRPLALLILLLLATPAAASGVDDPVVPVSLALAIILVSAKIFGHIAETFGQPAVLGELIAGMVLGALGRAFFPAFQATSTGPHVSLIAALGVLLLLFEVGLESTVGQMLKVGWPALKVAVTGVVVPSLLGVAVATALTPEASTYSHIFIGATLCATSVGITARVLKDLNSSQTQESRIILGAAVIDDVLGLIVLAVVAGSITAIGSGQAFAVSSVVWIAFKAFAFLAVALFLGTRVAPHLMGGASRLRSKGSLLAAGLFSCFGLSWLAAQVGLAPIVGAFAAGLILEEVHFKPFLERGEAGLEHLVHPIVGFLAPVFFVQMGMLTDVAQLLDPRVAVLGLALTIAGIAGKVVAGFAVSRREGPLDRLAIGFGMIPRGEVGLIFANVGLGLRLAGEAVIDARTYAAVVMMVILTTLVTPPLLKTRFATAAK